MSDFTITQGDTFLGNYDHQGSLAGVTFVAGVVSGAFSAPVNVVVTNETAGLAQFVAATDTWPPGLYLFQYRQTGASVVVHSYPRVVFTVEEDIGLPA
jgi:hypothetical protein